MTKCYGCGSLVTMTNRNQSGHSDQMVHKVCQFGEIRIRVVKNRVKSYQAHWQLYPLINPCGDKEYCQEESRL